MKVIITESQLSKIIQEASIMDEAPSDFQFFRNDESLEELRNALKNNKMVSVAFVKKDGTVRHMLVRRFLTSYIPSDTPKSDAQMNIEANNDIKRVIDISSYQKSLKALRMQGMDVDVAKSESAKKSWRTINLKEVLGFLVGGSFVDLRDENDIMNRYGQEIYNTLTKGMIKSMEAEEAELI